MRFFFFFFYLAQTIPSRCRLKTRALLNNALWNFWLNIKEVYDYFETRRALPGISVDMTGKYMITSP